MRLKKYIIKLIPRPLLNLRHLFYAWWGAVKYNHPSKELLVIGVTGTSGKSTTIWLLKQLLEAAGHTVGVLSTIEFSIAGDSKLNDKKMTMLGKMEIQRYLRKMVEKGCNIAIVETTSEGRLQYRHRFINYDIMLLTNLYPEHIESHGSFEKYRQAKVDLFAYAASCNRKKLNGKEIAKIALVNGGVDGFAQFLNFNFEKKETFGSESGFDAEAILEGKDGLDFTIHDRTFHAPLYGRHNVDNILAAVAVARSLDISWSSIQKTVSEFKSPPGRIEEIPEAEVLGFRVIVDYAFEPKALDALYHVVDFLKPKRIIHVCGATGGGRDKARRKPIGRVVGEHASIVIVTNEDPYDEDPMEIIREVSAGAEEAGKKLDKNLFQILDRREAIEKAIDLAKKGDLILITGKGCEQAIVSASGRLIAWDDREVTREVLRNIRIRG